MNTIEIKKRAYIAYDEHLRDVELDKTSIRASPEFLLGRLMEIIEKGD